MKRFLHNMGPLNEWFVQYLRKPTTLIDSMYFLYRVWISNFKLKCIYASFLSQMCLEIF